MTWRFPGLAALWVLGVLTAFGGTVERQIPAHFVPGQALTVSLLAEPGAADWNYAVEDAPPEGWTVSQINRQGHWDPATGRVKWGPFPDNSVRLLTYRLTPPADETRSVADFSGRASFSGGLVDIQGPASITLKPSLVTRELPDAFEPGVPVVVRWHVEPREGVRVHAIEDSIPAGWTASEPSHGGQVDLVQGKLKWGPYDDDTPRILEAELTPPDQGAEVAVFTGTATFDSVEVAIAGVGQLMPEQSVAYRVLPPEHRRGEGIEVLLTVLPAGRIQVYAVAERIPDGWTFESASEGGLFDSVTRQVKWGPFQDAAERTLAYRVTSPSDPPETSVFTGEAVFDSDLVEIAGPSVIALEKSRLTRSIPATFLPGAEFTLGMQAEPAAGVVTYAVEEVLPSGWTASAVSHGGRFDEVTGKVKWGPYSDGASRSLTCVVRPPEDAGATAQFSGIGVFDSVIVPAGGPWEMSGESLVVRTAPAGFRDGETVEIRLGIQPLPSTTVYSVEERVPEGWTVESVSDSGVLDAVNGLLKWGPFEDATPRELVFRLAAPSRVETDEIVLWGRAVFGSVEVMTGGSQVMERISNRAPLVVDLGAERLPDQSIKIPLAKLIAVGMDPDGGTLSVVDVAPLSAEGGQVFLAGTWVVYLPPPGFSGLDSFTYTISDGQGALETGAVRIQVADSSEPIPPNAIRVEMLPDGSARVTFIGIAGRSYAVQASDDLEEWTTLGIATAGASGLFVFIDLEASEHPTRYYRSVDP